MSGAATSRQPGLLGLLGLAALIALPGYLAFQLGGESSGHEERRHLERARVQHQRAIAIALSEEHSLSSALRKELAGHQKALKAGSPASLAALRKSLEKRRQGMKACDRWLTDESLTLSEALAAFCRESLGEKPAGAALAIVKGARALLLQVRFPQESAPQPEALAKLAKSLSELNRQIEPQWLGGVLLERPQAKPLAVPLEQLSPEAWKVLLESFRRPHRQIRTSRGRTNSNLYRIGAISVSSKVKSKLELWGPEQVEITLNPGGQPYKRIPGGLYVLRTEPEGHLPGLGILEVIDGRMSELYLNPGR